MPSSGLIKHLAALPQPGMPQPPGNPPPIPDPEVFDPKKPAPIEGAAATNTGAGAA